MTKSHQNERTVMTAKTGTWLDKNWGWVALGLVVVEVILLYINHAL